MYMCGCVCVHVGVMRGRMDGEDYYNWLWGWNCKVVVVVVALEPNKG